MWTKMMTVGALGASLLLGTGPLEAQMAADQPPAARASSWKIDTTHSELTFRIRHLISKVRGTFNQWNGEIAAEPNQLGNGSVNVSIDASSIDTGNERRDNHLRSGDFFDAENHPRITFRSRKVDVQGNDLRITGDLTMRGVTRPVVLEGGLTGIGKDGQGRQRMGFEASTKISRQDFGVSWNDLVEGAHVLGDEVEIQIVVAAVKQ